MKNALWLAGLLLEFLTSRERARGQAADRAPRWSAGTSLTYPIARIYQVHIGYRLGERHEIIFGPAYQNFESGSITSGVGLGVFRTNRPPRFQEDIRSPSFAPQLILGVTG